MKNATLYVTSTRELDEATVRRAANGATVSSKRRGLFRASIGSFVVRWSDLESKVSILEDSELREHLQGLSGFVASRGVAPESDLMRRLDSVTRVVGIVVSDDAASGRAVSFVWDLASALDAFVFLPSGELFECDGRPVAMGGESPDDGVEDEDDVPREPPSASRVARRALALCGVIHRSFLEMDPPDDAASRAERAHAWLVDAGVWDELEEAERALVSAPMKTLSQRAFVDGSWRSEGLAVLAWSLGLRDLPPHDEQCDPHALWEACGFLGALPPPLLVSPSTRPPEERETTLARIFAIHWRLRDFRLRPEAMDFRKFAPTCWFHRMDLDGVALVDDDLSIRGKAIAVADAKDVNGASSIAMERRRAIEWLCGQTPLYSDVDTST